MPPRWNENRLTAKLGIDYPIIQGPLGGLSSQRLTAAASNFGGLGSFGALSLLPEEIKNVISQIRSLTSKPFAVNLWVSMEDDGARTSDEAAFKRSLAPLARVKPYRESEAALSKELGFQDRLMMKTVLSSIRASSP